MLFVGSAVAFLDLRDENIELAEMRCALVASAAGPPVVPPPPLAPLLADRKVLYAREPLRSSVICGLSSDDDSCRSAGLRLMAPRALSGGYFCGTEAWQRVRWATLGKVRETSVGTGCAGV